MGLGTVLSNIRTSFCNKTSEMYWTGLDWTAAGASEKTVRPHFGVRAEGGF